MKKFITVLLSFVLYFNAFSTAHAAGLDGWTLSNPIAQGASTLYNGAKQVLINGKNVAKTSTALIKPTATQVAKVLARGAAGYALAEAVNQLLGAVDWVLDPANNQIVYTVPNEANAEKLWQSSGVEKTNAPTAAASCALYGQILASNNSSYKNLKHIVVNGVNYCASDDGEGMKFSMTQVANPAYDPTAEDEIKTLPLDAVANQVISNAESGNAAAQAATTAAAADVVNDAQNDSTKARPIVDQLEANAKTETDANANNATGEAKPNTGTGATDLSIAFPAFCGWAPLVCEAAQSAISFPKKVQTWWDSALTSITQAWTEATEYFRKERNSSDDSLDIPVPTNPPIDSSINFGGSCPADKTADINMGVGTIKMDFTYTHICTVASDIRGIVIFCGFFLGALIIGGIKQ